MTNALTGKEISFIKIVRDMLLKERSKLDTNEERGYTNGVLDMSTQTIKICEVQDD